MIRDILITSCRFQNVYGFDHGSTGLSYLGQAVGSIVGLFIILYVYYFYWAKEVALAKLNNKRMAPVRKTRGRRVT